MTLSQNKQILFLIILVYYFTLLFFYQNHTTFSPKPRYFFTKTALLFLQNCTYSAKRKNHIWTVPHFNSAPLILPIPCSPFARGSSGGTFPAELLIFHCFVNSLVFIKDLRGYYMILHCFKWVRLCQRSRISDLSYDKLLDHIAFISLGFGAQRDSSVYLSKI